MTLNAVSIIGPHQTEVRIGMVGQSLAHERDVRKGSLGASVHQK